MAEKYIFITRWETTAPITDVWLQISNSLDWPSWWKDFVSVKELNHGSAAGIGCVRQYTLQSPTRYKLTFELELTEIVEFKLISGKAKGELEGTGTWRFEQQVDKVVIECHWNVVTTKRWMNLFVFVLRPAFIQNHQRVMRQGALYLSERIGREVKVLS